MLGRLVTKLLFKACIPLVAVAGMATYGVYLRGGDPGAIWTHVANGAFGKAGSMLSNARASASSTVEGMSGKLSQSEDGRPSTEVYMWKDEAGVTHYSNSQPTDINTTSIHIDPNVNVVVPVQAPQPDYSEEKRDRVAGNSRSQRATQLPMSSAQGSQNNEFNRRTNDAVDSLEAELGEPLPGIAGQILSGKEGAGGMDPSQLIKLLQSAN